MPDFLPRRGHDLLHWSGNFDRVLGESAEVYGIPPELVAQYSVLNADFAEAFLLADSHATDSRSAICRKNLAETALRALARVIARIARAWPLVTDSQLLVLGLRPKRKMPSRIPAPQSAPNLFMDHPRGREVMLRLRDAELVTSAAKPRGVKAATIFYAVGETYPTDEQEGQEADGEQGEQGGWRVYGTVTRTNVLLTIPAHIPTGAMVWITARWLGTRAQPGPLARPICTHAGYGIIATQSLRAA